MIELRWLEKRPGGVDFIAQSYSALRVLQYRDTEQDKWGEWITVPTVVEDEPKTQIGAEDIS